MLLAVGVLAERLDRRFGSAVVCVGVAGVIGLTVAVVKLFEASDAMIFRASGVISGHSLMHL
jgi:hypothetical protein